MTKIKLKHYKILMSKVNTGIIIKYLKTHREELRDYLNIIVVNSNFSYKTFGAAIEEHLSQVLIKLLSKDGFIKNRNDYMLAPHKNYFPDFTLNSNPKLAIEYKSGNISQFRDGKWINVKNSENDMGTLNEWQKKIDKFGGNNIYYIFVVYNFNDKTQEIVDIQIDPFYKFIGLNSFRVLKYREKDGNLRPKNFSEKSPISDLKHFTLLLGKTNIYRSRRIILKHKRIIKDTKLD